MEALQQAVKVAKKKKKKVLFEYTPTLGGIGKQAERITGSFTGFEVRGNKISFKPVVVKKHPRRNLKFKKFVKRYRRRKPK